MAIMLTKATGKGFPPIVFEIQNPKFFSEMDFCTADFARNVNYQKTTSAFSLFHSGQLLVPLWSACLSPSEPVETENALFVCASRPSLAARWSLKRFSERKNRRYIDIGFHIVFVNKKPIYLWLSLARIFPLARTIFPCLAFWWSNREVASLVR